MFKKKTKIIAGLMSIILLTSVFCVPVSALDIDNVSITFDTSNIKTLTNTKKVGVNLEMSMISDEMWYENGFWMDQSFTASDVPIMRWGYDAWVYDWGNEIPLHSDKYFGANNSKDAAGSFGLYEFTGFCKEHNVIPFVDIPIESHDFNNPTAGPVTLERIKQLTFSMAKYLNNNGIQEVYFDMGNEPWSTGSNKFGKIPAEYYGDLFKEFQPIIKAVNPNYKLVLQHAPDNVLWKTWNSTAENHAAGYFDSYDDHQYYFINWDKYYNKNDDNFFSTGKTISGVEPIMGECNIGWTKRIYPNEWKDGHARDLGGSLALLNALLDIVNKDFYHQIITWPSHYPSEVTTNNSGVTANAFGWFNLDKWYLGKETERFTGPMISHMIVNQNVLDKTVATTSSNSKVRTFAYTNKEQSELKLIVISKLWHEQLNVNITLPQQYKNVNASVMKGERVGNTSSIWNLNPVYSNHLDGNVALTSTQFKDMLPYGECAVVYTFYNDNSTQVPKGFDITTPQNGAKNVSTAQNFNWKLSAGATNYRITISKNADLTNPVIQAYTGNVQNFQVMKDLDYSSVYFWQVEAINKNGITNSFNRSMSFTTVPQRTFINDFDSRVTYIGRWNGQTSKGCLENNDHSSNTQGSTATINFSGTGVKVYGIKGNWCGKLSITVDDGAPAIVDTYIPDSQVPQSLLFETADLQKGSHTVKLCVLGEKNKASQNTWTEFDFIEIT